MTKEKQLCWSIDILKQRIENLESENIRLRVVNAELTNVIRSVHKTAGEFMGDCDE